VIEAYIAAANAGAGLLRVIDEHLEQHPESQGWLAMLEQLIPLYRLVLLDDVAEELRHIPPPTLRRAAEGPDVVTGLRLPAPRVRGRPANARASR
jgi:HPt (histidine-containing phosphotransfer) domain-containing protein